MDTRTGLVEKIKQQLAEWESEINQLEGRMEYLQGEAQAQLDETLAALKERRGEVMHRLSELEVATEHAWADLKDGLELALDSLKLGFLSAKSEFVKKEKDEA